MRKSKSGFTIVELLIVIVVIAVLAAITIVAYNGIQSRARDNLRYTDAKAIMKALHLKKVHYGNYPPSTATAAAICGSHTNGYSYGDATDGTWLKPLVDGGYLKKAPLSPNNGCSNFYRYLRPSATSYNCPSRTNAYYVLEIYGVESTQPPGEADVSDGVPWKPCPAATAGWGSGTTTWAFVKDDS
jgi:general secretion pathway protein G